MSVSQFEVMARPPEARASDNPWPQWPAIFRTSSAHEEGGERLYSVSTERFIGDAQGRVAAILSAQLGKDAPERVFDLIRGRSESPLQGLISGSLDLDKIEYLKRDAFMCGVPYGEIDVDRLTNSLVLVDDPDADFSGPQWSPDGRQIVAERRRLHAYDLVLIDPGSRAVRTLVEPHYRG